MILAEHREALLSSLPQRDRRPIWQIADGRFGMDRTRPSGEKWQLSRTPWLRQPLDDFKNDDVREMVLMAGSQCAKTAPMLIALAWVIKHAPAPILWITGSDDLAKDASQERVTPSIERCPDAVSLMLNNRLDKTTWKIRLKTCTVDIAGAQSSTALEQNPYRYVFGDEVRQWPEGSLQKVEKRQRSFSDAKRCFFSTPMLKGDEFHQRYLAGAQYEWVWPCMKCRHEQKLTWKGLKYGTADCTHDVSGHSPENGSGSVGEPVSSEVRLYCEKCGGVHADTPMVRRHILEKGYWQAQNQHPTPGVVSYHWSALLPPWVKWADLVDEWKRANEMLKIGNIEPLKVFICESLGEPWEEGQEVEKKSVVVSSYKLADVHADGWDFIFMVVDVQAYEFWHIVRGWKKDRTSQLLSCGRLRLWEDVRAKANEYKLTGKRGTENGKAHLVFCDLGYNPNGEVSKVCAEQGWTGLRGDDRRHFRHQDGTLKLYSEPNAIDVGIGTETEGQLYCTQFLFAQPAAQDLLDWLLDKRTDSFQIPADVPDDYKRHLRNEPKVERINRVTNQPELYRKRIGPQHMRDCEVMGCVAASMAELIWEVPKEEEKK